MATRISLLCEHIYIYIWIFIPNSNCIRLVDASLLDWRELGLEPWLLPIRDRRRHREVSDPSSCSEMLGLQLMQASCYDIQVSE